MNVMERMVRSFVENDPQHAALVLEQLDPGDSAKVLERLPAGSVSTVFERMTPAVSALIFKRINPKRAREELTDMSPRYAAAMLLQLETLELERVVEELPTRKARQLKDLMQYPTQTAGGMMDPHVTAIPVDLTVDSAIAVIRKALRHTLHYLYVVDRDDRLCGVLPMRELLLASPKDAVETIMIRKVASAPASMNAESVVELMQQRKFLALPVVDDENRLLGVIKAEQAIASGKEQAYEDVQKMVGVGAEERALWPVQRVVKSRLPWLMINLVTAFLAAAVVGLFENVIAQITALAVLLPIVAGQGGNCGAQALAVTMRGLALKEILPSQARRILRKELFASCLTGLAIAVVTAVSVVLWDGRMVLGFIIGIAMIINMIAAASSGALIPLILKALGRDPAQSSSIVLTTVTDVVGFAAFLGLALIFSPLMQ